MRPYLFETDEFGYIDDERTKWFEEFRERTSEELTYVALITDYNSAYFGNPDNLVRKKASEKILKEKGVLIEYNEEIALACEGWKTIQYDHLAEQEKSQINVLDVYTRALNDLTAMGDKADVDKIDKATTIQQRAEKEIERLHEKVIKRVVEDSKTRGDRATNFYEKWRKDNAELFVSLTGKKKEIVGT